MLPGTLPESGILFNGKANGSKKMFEPFGTIILKTSVEHGFRVQISSQNREANLSHPMGEIRKLLLTISFNTLYCIVAVN